MRSETERNILPKACSTILIVKPGLHSETALTPSSHFTKDSGQEASGDSGWGQGLECPHSFALSVLWPGGWFPSRELLAAAEGSVHLLQGSCWVSHEVPGARTG